MSTGLFISFEGIDGAGKSTHIPTLAQALRNRGRVVTLTREPGGTQLAEALRELVLHKTMDALTESLLIFAARRDHVVNVIAPALARGEVVLCDRFTDATFAYQGTGRGFDMEVLSKLEQWTQTLQGMDAILEPDLTMWFALEPRIAAERLQGVRVPDKFEAQPIEFFRKVAQGYAERYMKNPKRFACINASQKPHQVWLDIRAVCQAKQWL